VIRTASLKEISQGTSRMPNIYPLGTAGRGQKDAGDRFARAAWELGMTSPAGLVPGVKETV
jgi:hypothetical protein